MRLGEAVGLEWRDVDFGGRVLHVRRSVRKGRVSLPKNGKSRRVDMSQLAAFCRAFGLCKPLRPRSRASLPPSGAFHANKSRATGGNTFGERSCAGPELRYPKIHTLRHTVA